MLHVVADQAAHGTDRPHGEVHRRARFQAGHVVQQFAGGGEADTGQHGVQLPRDGRAVARGGLRPGNAQRLADDHVVEHEWSCRRVWIKPPILTASRTTERTIPP